MVNGHAILLAPFFVQIDFPLLAELIVVLDVHLEGRFDNLEVVVLDSTVSPRADRKEACQCPQ